MTTSPDLQNGYHYRAKLVKAGRLQSAHWAILGLSILLTIIAWQFSRQQLEQKIEERFNREAAHVIELVKERMTLYERFLWGAVALNDVNNKLDNNEWKTYADSLNLGKTYPGIHGIGIIYNIQANGLDEYLREQRINRPEYNIHPFQEKYEYWPITYIEPLATNFKAVGLDVSFESNRYNGIKKSRDSGLAKLTGPIALVQGNKNNTGFLFYAPFYRGGNQYNTIAERQENIIGVSYAPFIMHKLITAVLSDNNQLTSLKITDQGVSLYDDENHQARNKIDAEPLFTTDIDAEFYGRVWTFHITSNIDFRKGAETSQPYYILLGGIIIDLLILAMFLFLAKANRQALVYADRVTDELNEKTICLKKSNEDLEQFAYVASHDLVSPLNAIQKLISWIKEDCIEILPETTKTHLSLLESRTQRMINLLKDLLDYSRVGRVDFDAELLQIKPLTNDIFALLDHNTNTSLTVNDAKLIFPRVPFEIIMRNLISNAIKHHDKEKINLEVTLKELPNYYQICVQDDGPGIPPELTNKALEMFQTLQPRDKVEGSGMGLSLIVKIIEHYRGKLSIESDGIRGTKVIILLPIPNNTVG
ncbi:CHASE domain-containing sensor histidine kinase [Colwellia echini]|uniref:histidine kinase n=1 Tax=Colwellia echini TaxID=1982103 RepID=A0ABY3N0L3_9GAMM|nr:CHASE domain-containing protein [Colwellia echini]TYK67035.1 histidine kinase [Colwellia echini]